MFIDLLKNKKGYISIETVIVAGLVIALGAYALTEFYDVSQSVTHTSTAKIMDAMETSDIIFHIDEEFEEVEL
jgi:hypothetical protein